MEKDRVNKVPVLRVCHLADAREVSHGVDSMVEGSSEHGGGLLRGWVCTPTWELMKALLEEIAECEF